MKLPPRETWFNYILGAAALFVASVAAFFSIMGIGMLFSGAAISSMVMASSLELGKIVATSFLYRYWSKTTKFLKVYLSMAILILVVITSLGVFGWLSSAYQSSSMQYEMNQQQIAMMIEQKVSLKEQSDLSKSRVDNLTSIRNDQEKRMNEALNNPILSRNPTALRQVQEQNISLISQTDSDVRKEKENYNSFIKDQMDMDRKILDIKTTSSKTADVLTFKFVADAFGWELNSTVKWFIILIIVVFDPLAICLILSYNVALLSDKKDTAVIPTADGPKVEPPKQKSTDSENIGSPILSPTKILLNEIPVESSVVSTPIIEVVSPAPLPTSTDVSGLRHSEMYHVAQPGPERK